jgi:hypothetical protein
MECFPVCRTCTGLCKQVPVTQPDTTVRKRQKKPVVPKKLTGYIVMVCGHYTTMQEQVAIPGFRKTKKRFWCEKCGTWSAQMTTTEQISHIKETPMF